MFFPERMKRIRMLAHESCKQAAVKKLHELGAVQITDYRTTLHRAEWQDLLAGTSPVSRCAPAHHPAHGTQSPSGCICHGCARG